MEQFINTQRVFDSFKGFEGTRSTENPLYQFERDFLKVIMTDKEWGAKVIPFLSPNDFLSRDFLKQIYLWVKDFYNEYKVVLGRDEIYQIVVKKHQSGVMEEVEFENYKAFLYTATGGWKEDLTEERIGIIKTFFLQYLNRKAALRFCHLLNEELNKPEADLVIFKDKAKSIYTYIGEQMAIMLEDMKRINDIKNKIENGNSPKIYDLS